MRRHLISSVAAVAATGSLGLFATSALADGSSAAVAPGSASAVTQTATVTTETPSATATTNTPAATAATAATAAAATAVTAAATSTPAAATTGTTSSTTTPTTPAPTPKPKPKGAAKPKAAPAPGSAVAAKLTLSSNAFVIKQNKAVLQGRYVKVTGSVSHYVPGQSVEVTASLNRKTFRRGKLAIKQGRHGTGTFTATVKPKASGILRVQVAHKATPQLKGFSRVIGITSMSTSPSYGSTSLFVDLVQQKLAALHLYIPQTGIWDSGTELAVDAYHRLLNRGYSTVLDPATLNDLLAGKGSFPVRYPKQGRHVEGNLGKQLAALIVGSKPYWIFPISSGKPSTPTILGSFQIYSRVPGYLPDGMYYSDFFIRGYALHGYDPSPDYPASHGCMRLPIQDAIAAFNWLQIGEWVDVYQDSGNYSGTT
jgi:L,D-transpeptidase catalytic domain